jgi:superfamily II DNA/RNA helicase
LSKFTDLNLSQNILKAVSEQGYTKPTPIQEKSIPLILQRKDLLAGAQTGTGKTAGFTLPILELLTQTYVHHIGRTGRAGNSGVAVSLVCVDEHDYLRDIEKLIKKDIEKVYIEGFDVDKSIKAEPIQNGRGGSRGGGRSRNSSPKSNSSSSRSRSGNRARNSNNKNRNRSKNSSK